MADRREQEGKEGDGLILKYKRACSFPFSACMERSPELKCGSGVDVIDVPP